MTYESTQYSVIRDHANALFLVGKIITIRTLSRPSHVHPYINGQTFPGRSIPRIDIYYPLVGGDTRDDVIAHECAHIAYADMTLDKFYPEVEAINIIANIEPELIEFYSSRNDLGEECVVRLADLRRQGMRLPRMSPRLTAITRTLSKPKPVRAGRGPVCCRGADVRGAVMIFRFFPRMSLAPIGMVTRTRIIRTSGGQGQKDPESGSKSGAGKGLRVLGGDSKERRRKVLADWLRTRRVDSGKKGKKAAGAGAVAAALVARSEFDVTAKMAGRVYRDLQAAKPLVSG